MPNTTAVRTAQVGAAPLFAGKNKFINGDMSIWQRGTSFASQSTNDVYTADRWKTSFTGTSLNVTISRSTDVPNVSFPYSLKFQQLSNSATSVTNFGIAQGIETPNATVLFGKAVTISFWYKSNLTGSHYIRIYTGGQTGGVDNATAFTVNVADTWEYKTITTTNFSAITAVANANLGAQIDIGRRVYQGGTSTTINTNDYFQLAGVQIEAGSTATSFQTATGTIQGELAACQRYFRLADTAAAVGQNSTNVQMSIQHTGMRVAPAVATTAALTITDVTTANFTQSSGSISIQDNSANGGRYTAANFSGITNNRFYIYIPSGGAIQLSAEL